MDLLRPGENTLALEVGNRTGPGGVTAALAMTSTGGHTEVIHTDKTWAVGPLTPGWASTSARPKAWKTAKIVGPLGGPPWGDLAIAWPTSIERWTVTIPDRATEGASRAFLRMLYKGDVLRVYHQGKLVADDFYMGRPVEMGLWGGNAAKNSASGHAERTFRVEIVPLDPKSPVYLTETARPTFSDNKPVATLESAELFFGSIVRVTASRAHHEVRQARRVGPRSAPSGPR